MPLGYVPLRQLWAEWDQGDPAEVEEALRVARRRRARHPAAPGLRRSARGLRAPAPRRSRGREVPHQEPRLRRPLGRRRPVRQRGQGRPRSLVRSRGRAPRSAEHGADLRRQGAPGHEPHDARRLPVRLGRPRRDGPARREGLRLRDDVRARPPHRQARRRTAPRSRSGSAPPAPRRCSSTARRS